MRFTYLLFGALLVCGPVIASAPLLSYEMDVRLLPEQHRLEASVTINHPPANQFALNKSLVVKEVVADGKHVPFHTEQSTQAMFGADQRVVVETRHFDKLVVKYAGEIASEGQTQLTPDLIELLLNANWYPQFTETGLQNFSFSVTADLPQNFIVAVNAKQIKQHSANGRLTTVWKTAHATFDMVLLASPHFKQKDAGKSSGVDITYRNLPDATIAQYLSTFGEVRPKLTALYGPLQGDTGVSVVFSPRPGSGGYSRLPLIVFGEPFIASIMRGEFAPFKGIDGNAVMYYGVAHEIAHNWWTVADFNKSDGWIDEAIAEFTAMRLARARYPIEGEKLLETSRKAVLAHPDAEAIAETSPWAPHRYLNWYQRTTVMFFAAQDRFGEAAINRLLCAFYAKFKGTHDATTAAFLDEAERQIGKDGRAFFEAELYRKPVADTSAKSAK